MNKDSRPARVLMAVGKMDRGGMETMLMNLYRCVDRDRLQFDFLCTKPGNADFDEEILALGGRIFHTSLPKQAGSMRILEEMRKVMEEKGPFVAVHAHLLFFNGFVLLSAKRAGIPIRISHSHASSLLKYHSLMGKGYAAFMRRLLIKNATCLLACSRQAGIYLYGERAVQSGRVELFANAVDVDAFEINPNAAAALRTQFGAGEGTLVIGQVGRMIPEKNHVFLLELARLFKEQGIDCRFLIIGDGPLRESLQQKVALYALEDVVVFTGLREDVSTLLQALDVYAMPSLMEGLPVALVEAQAAGLPCVVSDGVSKEADLGLSLVRFVPVDPHYKDAWMKALSISKGQPRPSREQVRAAFARRGFEVKENAARLYALYQLSPQNRGGGCDQ